MALEMHVSEPTYVRAVLESEHQHQHPTLEEERKCTTGIEDHLALELSFARILSYGSRSASGR